MWCGVRCVVCVVCDMCGGVCAVYGLRYVECGARCVMCGVV